MFDEQPDGDPHGECAAEIARLTAELKEARQDLRIHEGINVERDARLVQAEERIRYLTMDLEEKERPLDAQMARLNANLIAANEKVLFLDREYGRVCKELNPVRAEVERLKAVDKLAIRFLTWKLPDDVCADPCASMPGYPGRSGTNLLNAPQARAMLAYVLADGATKT